MSSYGYCNSSLVLQRPVEPRQSSHAFIHALRRHRLQGSMGRVGACADNAAMESFFALLQKNVLDRRRTGCPSVVVSSQTLS